MDVKPIIFSGPMVRAILEGRKTQTRRVYKDQAAFDGKEEIVRRWPQQKGVGYAPGDILWVREAHYLTDDGHEEHAVFAEDTDDVAAHRETILSMQGDLRLSDAWAAPHLRLRPSIHMPRWASRLTLEVTEVRVQRLQEISTEDASAEGMDRCRIHDAPHVSCFYLRDAFRDLWDSLNEKRGFGWDVNPWVVAVTFEPHQMNVDDFLKSREAA